MFKLATQETKDAMRYTLVRPNREPMKFYIRELAEVYQSIYGGILLDGKKPALRLVEKLAA